MLRNQQALLRSDHDDNLTVQVTDANSHLGSLLLEADWSDVSRYLATPEGQIDVDTKNDPIGLFYDHSADKSKNSRIPRKKNTAFFASLFVRAPYEVIEKIYTMASDHVDQPEDLMYVLSVIPSEEEDHLREVQRKSPRTRTWTKDEYNKILDLLLQLFISSKSPSSSLLDKPSWIIGNRNFSLTPLAVAAYNTDVPAHIVQHLCALEPKAMDKECTFCGAVQVQTIPLIIAAASPLPPYNEFNKEQSPEYNNAKALRWEKVKLLTLSKDWYSEEGKILQTVVTSWDTALPTSPPPEPTVQQIRNACEESMRRNEWELVRELLKHHYQGEMETFEPITSALAQHDKKIQSQQQKREKARARDQWLHKNMGLVMYPVDAFLDLVFACVPTKEDGDEASGIVAPMS